MKLNFRSITILVFLLLPIFIFSNNNEAIHKHLSKINFRNHSNKYNDSILNLVKDSFDIKSNSEFLLLKSEYLRKNNRIDSAINIINKSIYIAKESNNNYLTIVLHLEKGDIYIEAGKYRKSLKCYHEALKIGILNNIIDENVAETYYKLALIYTNYTNKKYASKYLDMGISYSYKNNYQEKFVRGLNAKSKLFLDTKFLDSAIIFVDSARRLNTNRKFYGEYGISMEYYTRYYTDKKNYKLALAYCDTALTIYKEKFFDRRLAPCFTLKSHIFYMQGNIDSSIVYNKKALKIRLKQKHIPQNTMSSYLNLANDYYQLKNYDKALQILDSAKYLISKINMNYYYSARYFLYKSKIFEDLGNLDSALINYKIYKEKYDIYRDEFKGNEIRILNYETEILTNKNEINELNIENYERNRLILILSIVLIIFFTLLLITLFAVKIKQNKYLKRVNRLIKNSQEELLKAKLKAEESDRLKSEFLANMSHDIRTPLNGIVGFSRLLEYSEPDEKTKKEFTSIIVKNSELLLGLIDDIIEFSKMDAGELEVNPKEVNTVDIINQSIIIHQNSINEKGLKLNFNKEEDIIIRTDSLRLQQIINNLISNSVKYTFEGQIDISIHKIIDGVKIIIKDTGIGMDEEELLYVFDKFRRGKNFERTGKSIHGTGLGLSIVKKLIGILNGSISVNSEVGKGTEFIIILKNIE